MKTVAIAGEPRVFTVRYTFSRLGRQDFVRFISVNMSEYLHFELCTYLLLLYTKEKLYKVLFMNTGRQRNEVFIISIF